MSAGTDDTANFIAHFHDDVNIHGYVSLIDELIDAGEATIYASQEEQKKKNPELPRAKTDNGILMLYTLTQTPEGVMVHFSVSRVPYLPTALGRHIVELFMARSGWPKPAMFSVSDRQVFHAVLIVPEAQFRQIQTALPDLRARIRKSEDAKDAFLRGLLRAQELDGHPNSERSYKRSSAPQRAAGPQLNKPVPSKD